MAVFFIVPLLVEAASIPAVKAILTIQVPSISLETIGILVYQAKLYVHRPLLKRMLFPGAR